MVVVRRSVVLVVVLAAVLVPAGPAAASISASASLTILSPVTVGDSSLAGSFTVSNLNTPPNNTESNMVTQLRLVPSCATVGTVANQCSSIDPGVFSIDPTAVGPSGTACAGRTFTVSVPDSGGAVTFTPQTTVVLPPPGGVPGSNQCTVNFTLNVLKRPTIDANPSSPGVQTRANFVATVQGSVSGLVVSARPSIELTVNRAVSTLATQASRNVGAGTISDTASVTGVPGVVFPTGTVTFSAYGPNDANCTGTPATSVNPLSGGETTSDAFPAGAPGTYRFVASYSGDINYEGAVSPCNAPNESVVIPVGAAVADFDGTGSTDRSVYRPSTGQWFVQGGSPEVTVFGAAGDLAVPGDYDGDRTVDKAVYRPSTGQWFVLGGSPAVTVFGATGDIPVPADYDGNGTADKAVYRPSTGQWFVLGGSPAVTVFGATGDIPVPGDYDGNDTVNKAVYRPSTGQWFVLGGSAAVTAYGASGDIPVPADYDGNGTTDKAIYRPSSGTWFVLGGAPEVTVFGAAGDQPQPGDYDANGSADKAVYRPSTGQWFVLGGAPAVTVYGAGADVPLPLPYAIRSRFF
ncbi:MAG: Ig-like domain-containing protein [Acidimicrobiales bacterium]